MRTTRTLRSSHHWAALIDSCEARGCYVDAEDLLVVMRALGHEPRKEDLKKLVTEVDKGNTGQLDFDGCAQESWGSNTRRLLPLPPMDAETGVADAACAALGVETQGKNLAINALH